MEKITLSLQKRDQLGKRVKKLRQQGLIPANVFGKEVKSQAVSASAADFKLVREKAGETQIVYLQISGETKDRPTLITNIQYDPVSDQVLHVDFHQVDLKEKVTANIPLELVGEAPAAKDFQAVVVPNISEIEVEALPTDLPEKIEVDVTGLKQIGDSIKVSDLKINRDIIAVQTDPETIIVTATPQRAEEVIEAPAAPTTEEAVAPAEGAAPAETAETEKPAAKPKEA